MLHYTTVNETTRALLTKIFHDEELQDFTLIGGTALSLLLNHRISIDIDLTTVFTGTKWESSESLLDYLAAKYELKNYYKTGNFITGQINKIKVDFVLSPKTTFVKKPSLSDEIRVASLEDISAMKMKAILDRYAKKDVFDIATLASHYTLHEMVSFFKIRYPNYLDANLLLNLSQISKSSVHQFSGEVRLINEQTVNNRQLAVLLDRIDKMLADPNEKQSPVQLSSKRQMRRKI